MQAAAKVLLLAGAILGTAAAAASPTQEQIDAAVTFGGIATMAPLCGLRDGAWALDLRRSILGATTGSAATDDATLSTAPGSDLAQAALGYAEMEALEQFAAAEPAATCRPLTEHPDLDRADSLVRAFRARAGRPGTGS